MGEDDTRQRAPADRGLVRDICATGVWRIFPLTLLYVVGEHPDALYNVLLKTKTRMLVTLHHVDRGGHAAVC